MEKILLKAYEAAEILGIGRSLIYELIKQEKIPSLRLGRCIRIHSESLKKWIEEQQYSTSSENGDQSETRSG